MSTAAGLGAVMTFGAIHADHHRPSDVQPVVDERGGFALVADCRLDNRAALRRALSLPNDCHDSDLLRSAYRSWGDDLGEHLVGDFAVAIWDASRRRALLVRDHLGVKPLYYVRQPGLLTVATDLPLLIDVARPAAVPDDEMVIEYLFMNYHSRDRTVWSSIKRVPAGYVVAIDSSSVTSSSYWRLPAGEVEEKSTAEVHQAARRLLFSSVRRRLESDAPVIAHLSGGIDSTSIVCASRALYADGQRPPFVLGGATYPGLDCDESRYIQAVARETNFPLELWDARFEGLSPLRSPSDSGPWTGDQEVGDLMLARKWGARVLLSGQGGDFLFGAQGVADDIAAARPLRDTARRLLGPDVPFPVRVARARFLLRRLTPVGARRRFAHTRARLRAPDWLERRWADTAGMLAAANYLPESGHRMPAVKAAHWQGVTSAGLAIVLEAEQQRATASGLEMRYPLLDLELVTYILKIPFGHWPAPAPYSRLHRDFMALDLPELIRTRPKMTFSEGVAFRLRHAWSDVQALFFSGDWHSARYVNRPAAQALARRAEGTVGHEWELWRSIWAIATLESWLRKISRYSTR